MLNLKPASRSTASEATASETSSAETSSASAKASTTHKDGRATSATGTAIIGVARFFFHFHLMTTLLAQVGHFCNDDSMLA